jgi:putative component of membrane protein insertase Oxa1/YidC/SpoIIIJ protein YidD
MLDAINEHGYFRGITKGVYRLLRCNPFSNGGVDEITRKETQNVGMA